jgi:hypothetical protein
LQPQKKGEPCFAIFKLAAPAALTSVSVGAHLNMVQTSEPQFIEAAYSLDQGQTWQSVWRQENTSNRQDPEFEIGKRVDFVNQEGANEALVKFTMQRNAPYCAINGIRLYGTYRQIQPENAQLTAEVVWQERHGHKWEEKRMSLTASRFPQETELMCGGDEVSLEKISMPLEERKRTKQ